MHVKQPKGKTVYENYNHQREETVKESMFLILNFHFNF